MATQRTKTQTYEVSVHNTYEATDPVDAVRQMAGWLYNEAFAIGYGVTAEDGTTVHVDAEDGTIYERPASSSVLTVAFTEAEVRDMAADNDVPLDVARDRLRAASADIAANLLRQLHDLAQAAIIG